MKPLIPCLLLLALAQPLAFAQSKARDNDGEFHDPFATEGGAGSKSEAPPVKDPLERMNRVFFHFNDKLYSWVLRPVSKGYRTVAPRPVRESVDRFFTNLKYPIRGVNNLLEGRFSGAGIETARFVVNTTVGIGGLFDPASHWKLKAQPADFDKTLAIYRVPTGCYLNLPVIGPTSPRGVVGLAGDTVLNPMFYLDSDWWVGPAIGGAHMINTTSLHLEEYDSLRSGTLDPYVAMRSAYFEHRRNAAKR